jgi:hypothetical protein
MGERKTNQTRRRLRQVLAEQAPERRMDVMYRCTVLYRARTLRAHRRRGCKGGWNEEKRRDLAGWNPSQLKHVGGEPSVPELPGVLQRATRKWECEKGKTLRCERFGFEGTIVLYARYNQYM